MKNVKEYAVTGLFLGSLLLFGLGSLAVPDKALSFSERRPLTRFQTYSEKKHAAGKQYSLTDYAADLETYLLDQFPGREGFRSLKALFKKNILLQRDNNGYYAAQGHLGKLDETMHPDSLRNNLDVLTQVYNTYFSKSKGKVYYAVIPDKNAFLAPQNGYPHYDYAAFLSAVSQDLPEKLIPISLEEHMSLNTFYLTDPHWNQAELVGLADALLKEMGSEEGLDHITFQENRIPGFYGTFHGQAALPVAPEALTYLTAPILEEATAYHYAAKQTSPLYIPENFTNVDPYDVFLDGAVPLVRIQNPNAARDGQLVVFRDSFGSSLVPLLAAEYREIIVVDIRYISPKALAGQVRFRGNADVLMLYSTSVLNTHGIFLN